LQARKQAGCCPAVSWLLLCGHLCVAAYLSPGSGGGLNRAASCHLVPGIAGEEGSQPRARSLLGSAWAFSLSHVIFLLPQGVIDLEALGKKGYNVPKAGTIQVVSHPLASVSAVGRGPAGLQLPPPRVGTLHYVACQGSSQEACGEGGTWPPRQHNGGEHGLPGVMVIGDAREEEVGEEGQGLGRGACTCSGDGMRWGGSTGVEVGGKD